MYTSHGLKFISQGLQCIRHRVYCVYVIGFAVYMSQDLQCISHRVYYVMCIRHRVCSV